MVIVIGLLRNFVVCVDINYSTIKYSLQRPMKEIHELYGDKVLHSIQQPKK